MLGPSADSDSGSMADTESDSTAAVLWKLLCEQKDLKDASSKQQ